jgi:aminocarboxymuconate-semialdehyde decarboxylase
MPIIDVHAHYFPPAVVETFERCGGPPVWPPHPDDIEVRVAALAAAGIDRQVIGLGHCQPYIADAAAAGECAAFCNDLYADLVAAGEGRLAAFAALPMTDPEGAVVEAGRCLGGLGLAGVGLGTTVAGRALDDPRFEPVWAELDAHAAVVFLHPVGRPPTDTPDVDPYMIGTKLGGPHELATAATRLLMSGVTTRYPNVRFVLAAGGGSLAFLWPRFTEMSRALGHLDDDVAFGGDLDRAPREFWYDTALSDDPRPQRYLIEALGLDRLVLGTDAPRVSPEDWIGKVRAGLAVGEVEPVLGGNAAALGLL